jgi:hypothetical protein
MLVPNLAIPQVEPRSPVSIVSRLILYIPELDPKFSYLSAIPKFNEFND